MGNRSTRVTNQELLNSLNDQSPQDSSNQIAEMERQASAEVLVETLQMDANIERGSFRLEKLPEGTYSLEFVFSAASECCVTISMFATEIIDSFKVTQAFKVDTEKYPGPSTYKFSKGLLQPFPPRTAVLDLSNWSEQQLTFTESTLIPLVVEIRSANKNSNPAPFEASIMKFMKTTNGDWIVKVLKQKFTVTGRSFELYELFGADNEGNECIVCMTLPKDTSVLPCRHLCLCKECANVLRVQHNSRCPICRVRKVYTAVDGLLELRNIGE